MLLEIDEPSVLEKVRQLLLPNSRKTKQANVVGYKPNGDPITQAEFEQHMKNSIDQAERGEVMSHEDLVKEAENW